MSDPANPNQEPFSLPPDFDMAAFEGCLDAESKQLVDEMRSDAVGATPEEREAIEGEVQHFLGEMALGEWVQAQADAHIQRAKDFADGTPTPKKEVAQKPLSMTLDGAKIGWIPGDSGITVALEQKGDEQHSYLFGSIVDDHRVTKAAYEHLESENMAEYLTGLLHENAIPRFLEALRSGTGGLRPISIGNRAAKDVRAERSLNTQYPAYKVDVQGTRNRAILLLPPKDGEDPVIILAAIYDHEDQSKVGNALYLKWVPKK